MTVPYSVFVSAFVTTHAQFTAGQVDLETRTPCLATFLAPASYELSARFCHIWKACPERLQTVTRHHPSSLFWIWQLGSDYQTLAPAMSSLKCSPLCMFMQGRQVGGSISSDLPFFENSAFRASLTFVLSLVRSYIRITKRWIISMVPSVI